jgi:putative phosphoesterase
MRIGILSDTHGLLRDEVVKALDGVDHIIHAGDIDRKEVIDSLVSIAPVTVVRGNADKDWAEHIPMTASIDLSGKRFYVIHNKAKIESDLSGYDVVVYGHSHKYSYTEKDGQIWFNPGCCGKRKPGQEISLAIAEVTGEDIIFEKVVIDNSGPVIDSSSLPKNIDSIIRKAMKLTDKGKGAEDIARSCHISPALADDICRMYLTHPGIDVAGILQRIEGR